MIGICSLLAETGKPKTREEIIAIIMRNTIRIPGEVYIFFFEGPSESDITWLETKYSYYELKTLSPYHWTMANRRGFSFNEEHVNNLDDFIEMIRSEPIVKSASYATSTFQDDNDRERYYRMIASPQPDIPHVDIKTPTAEEIKASMLRNMVRVPGEVNIDFFEAPSDSDIIWLETVYSYYQLKSRGPRHRLMGNRHGFHFNEDLVDNLDEFIEMIRSEPIVKWAYYTISIFRTGEERERLNHQRISPRPDSLPIKPRGTSGNLYNYAPWSFEHIEIPKAWDLLGHFS
jgi:hypothetical protein